MPADNTNADIATIPQETGLEERVWDLIVQRFASFPEIEKAVLYGSRAKGTARHASDIDLTLMGDQLTWQDFQMVERALDDLLLPWKIDLSLYRQIENPDLRSHISRVGICIYQRND